MVHAEVPILQTSTTVEVTPRSVAPTTYVADPDCFGSGKSSEEEDGACSTDNSPGKTLVA